MVYIVSGGAISFFIAALLIAKKNRTPEDVILAIWLFVIGTHLLLYYSAPFINEYYLPYFLLINFPYPCFHGPLLYAYTSSLTKQDGLKKHWYWHAFPIVMLYFMLIPFYLLPQSERMLVMANGGRDFELERMIQNIVIMASGTVYVLLSLRLLKRHKKAIEGTFSDTDKVNLNWLRYLVYGIGLVWLAVVYGDDTIIFALGSLFVVLLGYFGINQVGIFTVIDVGVAPISQQLHRSHTIQEQFHVTAPVLPEKSNTTEAISKAPISHAMAAAIHRKLILLMDEQKPFLNSELMLADLSSIMDVHPNYLSYTLNAIEKKTFYDFINTRRIEEFKRRVVLPESQKYTLLGLAFDCGFNSKTAFYRNFKNATGLSPSQYLRQNNISLES